MIAPRWIHTLVLVLACAFAAAAGPGSAVAADCPPYELIGARGSGQRELKSEDSMGPEVHDLFQSLQGLLGAGSLRGYGLPYPAVPVDPKHGPLNLAGAALHIGALGKYTGSVRQGQRETEGRIEWRHRRCPETRFVLAGYSQGAQAVGDALQRMASDKRELVAAAAFFGDPYFNADSWSARGGDPSEYGVFGPRPEWDESLHGRVFSYCHYHDAFCNDSVRHSVLGADVYVRSFDDIDGRLAAHGTPAYRSVAQGGQGDADRAALAVARALGASPAPALYSGPLDIAFVIDSTGSMEDEIDEVKDNVTALVGQIASVDPDYRLALVDYKDSPDQESDYRSRLVTDFTTDVGAFDQAVDSLEADGGGDEAESVYSGLMTALGLGWRAGARKIVVQIGDAPAKDPEPGTGLTLQAVQAKALAVDPATIDTFQPGDDDEAQESLAAIAAATGGQYRQLSEADSGGLVAAVGDEIKRSAAAPEAALTAPSQALAGRPVTLSAAASLDPGEPIAAYDWDFDGDGSFDLTTTDPVASHTYPAPFSGQATVRVRSASGLASLATAPIVVAAAASEPPARPRRLRAAVRGRSLTVEWRAGRGPAPQWFTVFVGGLHRRERVPVRGNPLRTPKGTPRRFEMRVTGLRRGRAYRISVAAGNDAGESRRAGPLKLKPRRHAHRGARKRRQGRGHRRQRIPAPAVSG